MNIYKLIKFNISLIILLQIFYKISSITTSDYPYSITLANDNIFLIQKTGIDIYDQYLNKLNQIVEFSGEEGITEEIFSKITIKYNKDYILSIINDKLFIFNNEGNLLYKSEEKLNGNQTIYSYSLTLIPDKNYCKYVIGYFDEDSNLRLNLYSYDNEKNNTLLLYKYKDIGFLYQIPNRSQNEGKFLFNYEQKLLSCEYMFARRMVDYKSLLVCFFNSNATIGVAVNYLEYDRITLYTSLLNNSLFISTQNIDNIRNITSIKSELNKNESLAIIWWTFEGDNQTRYFIYDLSYMIYMFNYYKVYKILKDFYSWKMPNTCINREYETRINVFPYKNQIVFSCTMEDENIQILLYNKTNLMNDSYIINVSCVNNNELSKFYFNDNKNYSLYPCIKDCSNIKLENDIDCLKIRIEEENKKKN